LRSKLKRPKTRIRGKPRHTTLQLLRGIKGRLGVQTEVTAGKKDWIHTKLDGDQRNLLPNDGGGDRRAEMTSRLMGQAGKTNKKSQ